MFAVIVNLRVRPDRMGEFLPLMLRNAATSRAVEPGCHRFDVCTDSARPGEVFLYELYADAAAFTAHLDSPHFKVFDAAVADMVIAKDVRTYTEVRS